MSFPFFSLIANFAIQTSNNNLSLITSYWYKQKSQKELLNRSSCNVSISLVEVTRQHSKLLDLQTEGQRKLVQVYHERNQIEMTRLDMEKATALLEHQDREQALALQAQIMELKNRELQLTQQLAHEEREFRAQESTLYRELLRDLKKQEIEVKLAEVQNRWDAIEKNWPSRLNRHDTEELLLKGREQYPLLLLVAPPNISQSCPTSFQYNLPQELRNQLKLFVGNHIAQNSIYPIEFYGDYFNRDIFDIDVKQLKRILAPLPSVVVYCDITDREVYFHVGTWGWIDVAPVQISSTPWNWQVEWKKLKAQGEEEEECLYQLRTQILGIYKVLVAFLADWYYVNLDRNYEPCLLSYPPENIIQEWLAPQIELLMAVRSHHHAWNIYEIGLQSLRAHEPEQAIKQFEEALQLSASFPEAQLGLGIALYEAKNYVEAERQLSQLLAISPHMPAALDYYGLNLVKLGRPNQAISYFEKLIEVQSHCAEGLQHLGDAYATSGRTTLAKTFWEQAKKLPFCRDQFGQSIQTQKQSAQFLQTLFHSSQQLEVGDTFRDRLKDGTLAPEMVIVPAGKFRMGSDEYESERPVHQVTIEYEFAIGKYPVTFEEYDEFCEVDGRDKPNDQGWGRGKRPVINVYWKDAKDYCRWLSEQTGKLYRLPSEAEWEYVCRAGSTTRYSFGDNREVLQEYAWYDKNSNDQTHPVGEKKPNPWGIYDMHGNVWEWCEDTWHSDYKGAPTDGSAWVTGGEQNRRLLRGGSWSYNMHLCRSTDRFRSGYRSYIFGFRLVTLVSR